MSHIWRDRLALRPVIGALDLDHLRASYAFGKRADAPLPRAPYVYRAEEPVGGGEQAPRLAHGTFEGDGRPHRYTRWVEDNKLAQIHPLAQKDAVIHGGQWQALIT